MPITQAESDRIHAEAAARGEQVFIFTAVSPEPSPVRRLAAALFPSLHRDLEPEAEL
jgi:hypothetical protein